MNEKTAKTSKIIKIIDSQLKERKTTDYSCSYDDYCDWHDTCDCDESGN